VNPVVVACAPFASRGQRDNMTNVACTTPLGVWTAETAQRRPKLMLPPQVFQAAAPVKPARLGSKQLWVPSCGPSPTAACDTPMMTPMNVASTAWRLEACPGAPVRRDRYDCSSHQTPASSPMAMGGVPPSALWPSSSEGTPHSTPHSTPLAADVMSKVMFNRQRPPNLGGYYYGGRDTPVAWPSPANTALDTGFIHSSAANTPMSIDGLSPICRVPEVGSLGSMKMTRFASNGSSVQSHPLARARGRSATEDLFLPTAAVQEHGGSASTAPADSSTVQDGFGAAWIDSHEESPAWVYRDLGA
jgi:hypothetical protein